MTATEWGGIAGVALVACLVPVAHLAVIYVLAGAIVLAVLVSIVRWLNA